MQEAIKAIKEQALGSGLASAVHAHPEHRDNRIRVEIDIAPDRDPQAGPADNAVRQLLADLDIVYCSMQYFPAAKPCVNVVIESQPKPAPASGGKKDK